LFQPAGQADDAALSAVLSTVAESVELSLAVLQRYEVTRLPAADPTTDLDKVRSLCRKDRIDQAILGSGAARADGGYDFRLVVYDRSKNSITVEQKRSSKGTLDLFDTTDALVASLLEALSGKHLAFGSLSIQSDPAGAVISVNEKDVGSTPLMLRSLPVGTIEVAGKMDGHEGAKATVTLLDGETVNVSLTLPRSTGTLSVQMPRDAVATIRSAEIGRKEITGTGAVQLPTGDYNVQANSPGMPEVSGRVTITQGEGASWMPWTKGYLDVRSSPPGATVSVDGDNVGVSPLVVELEPGAVHRVELRLENYETISADLDEVPGTKTMFSRTLKQVERAPQLRALRNGDPLPVASISIDGFPDWSTITPAFIGKGLAGNLHFDKIYLAVDEKNFYVRMDINDHTASSFFHPHNFYTGDSSNYGISMTMGSDSITAHAYYNPKRNVWAAEMTRHVGKASALVNRASELRMKGASVEMSFPLGVVKESLHLPVAGGPIEVGAYLNSPVDVKVEGLDAKVIEFPGPIRAGG